MDVAQLEQRMKEQSLLDCSTSKPHKTKDENKDSGTESDEETMACKPDKTPRKQQEKENSKPAAIDTTVPANSPPPGVMGKRPLRMSNHSSFQRVTAHRQRPVLASPVSDSSSDVDADSCSTELEAIPTSNVLQSDFDDRPSSEEELICINYIPSEGSSSLPNRSMSREKRSWDQANGDCSDPCSDEEVQELLSKRSSTPVMFSASPPRDLPRLTRTLSPHLFLAQVAQASECESPRKRYCQQLAVESTYNTSVIVPRPYLDFEKMQVYCC